MDMDIPIVDITSSQDEIDQINARKRKEIVTIVGNSPKRPKSSEDTPTSSRRSSIDKVDLDILNRRLATLENSVRQAEGQKVEDEYVTREVFDECVGRISRIEERLAKLEQLVRNVKSAFIGTNVQSKHMSYTENSAPREFSTAKQSTVQNDVMNISTETVIPSAANSGSIQSTSVNHTCTTNNTGGAPKPSAIISENELCAAMPATAQTRAAPKSAPRLSGQGNGNSATSAVNLMRTQQQQRKSLPTDLHSGLSGREQHPSNTNSRAEKSTFGDVSISVVHQRAGPSSTSGRDQQLSNTHSRAGPSSPSGRDQQLSNTYSRAGPSSTCGRDQQLSNTPRAGQSSTPGRDQQLSNTHPRAGPSSTPGRDQQLSNTHPRAGPSSTPGRDQQFLNTHPRAGPSSTSGRDQQLSNTHSRTGPSSTPGRDQQLSNTHPRAGPSSTSGRDQQLSNTHSRPGPSSTSRRDQQISNTHQRAGPFTTSGQELFASINPRAGPSSTSGWDYQLPCHSNWKNKLPQILNAPPSDNEIWSDSIAINMGELPEDIMCNIRRVKQEVYEDPLDEINTIPFRRDSDGRFLVYICGDKKKIRKQDIYAAVACTNLSNNWNRIIPYMSDIRIRDQGNSRKLGEVVRQQTQVVASFTAIEEIKRNSGGAGQVKIRIVTQCSKLVQMMSNELHLVYHKNTCVCSKFPCSHEDRWETSDNYASSLPDDLPRLVLATEGVDVVWRKYQEDDPVVDANEIKKEISNLLHKTNPRNKRLESS